MTKIKKVERLVSNAALRILKIDLLQADPSYQREVKAKHKRIVAEFDPNALGIPVIAERSDASLWIVDGLQRITALRKLGKKDVRAEVFASNGPEHEANIFKLINLNRAKLNPFEEFRALLAAHDKNAWNIKEAVASAGFILRYGKAANKADASYAKTVVCITTLRDVEAKVGADAIVFALNVIKNAWPGDPLGTNNSIIGGLASFYQRMEKAVDEQRLVARIRTFTPARLIYNAQMLSPSSTGGGGRSSYMADLIEKHYRRRSAPKKPAAQ